MCEKHLFCLNRHIKFLTQLLIFTLFESVLLAEDSNNQVIQWSDFIDLKETKKDHEDNFKADQLLDDLRQGRTKKYKTAEDPKACGILLEISYPEQWVEQEGTRPNTLKKFFDKNSLIVLAVYLEDFNGLIKSHLEKTKRGQSDQQKEAERFRLSELCKTSEEANNELLKNSFFNFYKEPPIVSKTIKSSVDGYPLFTTLVTGTGMHAGNEYPAISIHNFVYINDQLINLYLSKYCLADANVDQALFQLHRLNQQMLQTCIVLNRYNQKNVTGTTAKNTNYLSSTKESYSTDPRVTFRTVFSDKTVQEVYEKAERGDSNCQYAMGAFYATGEKVPKDDKKAFEWYKRSAEQNNPAGQLLVGTCYVQGQGIGRDIAEGLRWINKSADQGFPKAQMMLGLAYLDGVGMSKDISKAIFFLQKASDQNDYEAMVKLGLIYYLGDLVAQDQNKARALWKRAAAGGDKEAVKVLEMDKKGR